MGSEDRSVKTGNVLEIMNADQFEAYQSDHEPQTKNGSVWWFVLVAVVIVIAATVVWWADEL